LLSLNRFLARVCCFRNRRSGCCFTVTWNAQIVTSGIIDGFFAALFVDLGDDDWHGFTQIFRAPADQALDRVLDWSSGAGKPV